MAEDQRKTAAMQGGGFYNRNSGLQAANLTSALPLFTDAASAIPIDGDQPLVIVDYGSSQGRNSVPPIRAAIEMLRPRAGNARPIEVVHVDLASNDFAALFTMLAETPDSYLDAGQSVFPSAIGRSYFEPVMPPGRVDLGWSSNALHWMSRSPIDVADHGWALRSASSGAREAVDRQLADDWRRFLLARSSELRPQARLVCQFMGRGPDHDGFEWMAGAFWHSLSSMGDDGLLTSDELLRMTSPAAGRSVEQVEAPFADGPFAGLALDHLSLVEAPDPYWEAYQRHGDAAVLGQAWANMMCAANGPTFAAALAPDRNRDGFLAELSNRLATRVSASPQRSRSYNILALLRKIDD